MKKIAAILFFTGMISGCGDAWLVPQDVTLTEPNDLKEKVGQLNSVGTGNLEVCTLNYNTIHIDYSNAFGKRMVIRVYDQYIVNTVHMYLNKSQVQGFIGVLEKASLGAQENSGIEQLDVGKFGTNGEWVSLVSRKGVLTGHWYNDGVDNVYTSINANKLIECSKLLIPYLY